MLRKTLYLSELDALSQNLDACSRFLFRMSADGLSRVSGISYAVVQGYVSSPFPDPSVSNALRIAEIFCTDAGRMLKGPLTADAGLTLGMQEAFIRRAGGLDAAEAEKAVADMKKALFAERNVSPSTLCLLMRREYLAVIKKIDLSAVRDSLRKPCDAASVFSKNMRRLMNRTGARYTDIEKYTGISRNSLSDYVAGKEASVSAAVAISKFFCADLSELLKPRAAAGLVIPAKRLAAVSFPERLMTRDEAEECAQSRILALVPL